MGINVAVQGMDTTGEEPVPVGAAQEFATPGEAHFAGEAFRLLLRSTEVAFNEVWLVEVDDGYVVARAPLDYLVA